EVDMPQRLAQGLVAAAADLVFADVHDGPALPADRVLMRLRFRRGVSHCRAGVNRDREFADRAGCPGEWDQSASLRYFPQDRAAGSILLCTARPRSDLVIRTHQREALRAARPAFSPPRNARAAPSSFSP